MNFEEVKANIYPWIKKIENDGASSDMEYVIDTPTKPFLADLVIFFVADMGNRFEILQQAHIPEDMTVDDLYALATQNLINNIEFKLTPTNFGGYGILAGGNHEAGALCLDYLWEICAGKIGENLIVSVPAKDMLLMVGASQTMEFAAMKSLSANILADRERTLSSHLFLYDMETKKFSVFE